MKIKPRKNNSGLSFVAIMIIIAIVSLLLRFAIEKIIKINIPKNESSAQGTLKLISAALENYAKNNNGAYPLKLSALVQANPAYLDKDYTVISAVKGYDYSCSKLDSMGYNCAASPVKCKITGRKNYTISTGGLLVAQECSKAE
jgi:competence protein ComGC